MCDPLSRDIVGMLLSAMYVDRGSDGLRCSFFFGPPGSAHSERRIGTQVFFRQAKLTSAAIHLRQHGPQYMRVLPIDAIRKSLMDFAIENFAYLAGDVLFKNFECSYNERVSSETREAFAKALASSPILRPRHDTVLYPIVTVRVDTNFESDRFFLVKPEALGDQFPNDVRGDLKPTQFPPTALWGGKTGVPTSWLGVRSSSGIVWADKAKAAILGALSLTQPLQYRYQFSGRSMFGGHCIVRSDGFTETTLDGTHTPPMGEDIIITESDRHWLSILTSKLTTTDQSSTAQIKGLEYYYRAWPLGAPERFPLLFMALDSLFGDVGRATQALVEGMGSQASSKFDYARLKLLTGLRASVMHGGAPNVYESGKYQDYYQRYHEDPIVNLSEITACCLQHQIFGQSLVEHTRNCPLT